MITITKVHAANDLTVGAVSTLRSRRCTETELGTKDDWKALVHWCMGYMK